MAGEKEPESGNLSRPHLLCKLDAFCYFPGMARLPRVVVPDVPHHITQRGNARQVILATDAHQLTYLSLLHEYAGV